jgi:hypothetical protein
MRFGNPLPLGVPTDTPSSRLPASRVGVQSGLFAPAQASGRKGLGVDFRLRLRRIARTRHGLVIDQAIRTREHVG